MGSLIATGSASVDNITVDGDYVQQEVSMSKSGYTLIGIIGVNISNASSSGTNSSWCYINNFRVSGSNAVVRFRCMYTGKVQVTVYGLYVQSSVGAKTLGEPDDDDDDTKVGPGPEIIDPDDGDGSDTGGNTNPDDGDGGDTGGTVDPDPNTPLPEDPNDGDDGDDDDSNNPDGDDADNEDPNENTGDNDPNDDDDNEDGDNVPMEPVD